MTRKSYGFEHDALFAWLDEHPRVAVDMLQVLAHRMRDNNERISELVFMDVPGRLAKTLLNLASRFGEPVEAGLKVPHDLTQEEMAQLVGSSRETVNKALMDFANRGWIAREGRSIIIYQPGMLIRRSRRYFRLFPVFSSFTVVCEKPVMAAIGRLISRPTTLEWAPCPK